MDLVHLGAVLVTHQRFVGFEIHQSGGGGSLCLVECLVVIECELRYLLQLFAREVERFERVAKVVSAGHIQLYHIRELFFIGLQLSFEICYLGGEVIYLFAHCVYIRLSCPAESEIRFVSGEGGFGGREQRFVKGYLFLICVKPDVERSDVFERFKAQIVISVLKISYLGLERQRLNIEVVLLCHVERLREFEVK